MILLDSQTNPDHPETRRADELLRNYNQRIGAQTDRIFAALLVLQWIAGIFIACWISPRVWEGMENYIHPHVWAALILGGLIASLPVTLALIRPGQFQTRISISVAQMLHSALLIHLSGGRIEAHFHIFGSLAFLSFYRDWRVLVPATLVVAIDHLLRGTFWPQSVFGIENAEPWRWVEHSGWILFEDVFLFWSCIRGAAELRALAARQARLESSNERVRAEVEATVAALRGAEAQSRETQSRLACIVESSNDAIFGEDCSSNITSWNHAAERLFGYTEAEVLGRSGNLIEPPHRKGETDALRAIILQGGHVEPLETQRHRKDGQLIDVSVCISAVRNSAGEIAGFSRIIRDISRQKCAEAELRRAHAELELRVAERTEALSYANASLLENEQRLRQLAAAAEAANSSKSEFLANMSHEIRTPMTAILGYADMLPDDRFSAEERAEQVRIIQLNARHLLAVLNDILDLSKIEAGKMTVESRIVDVRLLIGEVLSLMRVQAVEKKLGLEATFRGAVPATIRTDPTRLRQILINLMGNAIKFTEHGGVQVLVSFTGLDDSRPRLQVEVIDSGIGLTAEQLERIFKPFMQGDTSTTRRFGGSGLGLTICRRLAQMLGGDISVQSRPSYGSRFTVTVETADLTGVPLIEEGCEAVVPKRAPSEPNATVRLSGRVLLAEDGIHNRQVITFYLQAAGAAVETAENGRIACEKVQQAIDAGTPFDAVLMDMQMPEMDGYAATSALRRQGFTAPIIALTANALMQDRDRCLACGCTNYMSKPIERNLLIAAMGRYLPVQPATVDPAAQPALADESAAQDANFAPFLDKFVRALPEMVADLHTVLNRRDLQDLASAIHQIKGSGGFFGFMPITEAAEHVEQKLRELASLDQISEEVKSLIGLMRSVSGYDLTREIPAAPTAS